MAMESQYDGEAARLPISLHPAFAAIVALWFAVLLGMGGLLLPAALLDRVVSATGLASLIPAASPPLGMTARAIIAFAGALGGAALGVAVARRVAQGHGPKGESRFAELAGGTCSPISVHEELGGEGVVNGESLPISRRRALAISEDDRPSDFLYRAPLPGDDFDAPAPFSAAPIVHAKPDDEPIEPSELAHAGARDEADRNFKITGASGPQIARSAPQHDPRGLEPLPFEAPSLARLGPESEPEQRTEPEPQLETVAVKEPAGVRSDWQTAPLEGLGLVQLVQRLGSMIERRRELMAQGDAPSPRAPAGFADADVEPAAPDDAVQAMAAFFGSAPTLESKPVAVERPAQALRSSLIDMNNPRATPKGESVLKPEQEAELPGPAEALPRMEARAPAASRRFDPPGNPPLSGEEGLASSAARTPPVPADTDAALRAALATLQRMSGTP